MSAADLDRLSEGVRTLHKVAAGFAPAIGFGLVRRDGPAHSTLTYVDPFGATAYRIPEQDVPEPFRPRSTGVVTVTAAALEANPLAVVESRLLHTSFSDDVKRECAVRQVITRPVPSANHGDEATLVLGLLDTAPLDDGQLSQLDSLARKAADYLVPAHGATSELDLLRRLAAVEKLLPTLFRVLDVRGIFERLSAITKDMLRHDFASLGILSDDLSWIDLYVQTSPASYPHGGPMPFPRSQTATWLYRFVDDLTANPLERNREPVKAGGRSSLRIAIRLDETVYGALNFTSRETAPYTAADLAVARRIAEYVALALSHQRLAEESRRAAALRERAANLTMLDGLLNTLTGVLDIRDVFDRVSAIAHTVLPHDALSIAEIIDNGERYRIHASHGLGDLPQPFDLPLPDKSMASQPWDFRLIDDVRELPEYAHTQGSVAGMRSMLFVAIRIQGHLYGGLNFYSKAVGRFVQDDVLVARRITDHVALALSHQRLAEQVRHNEELRAQKIKSDLLDQLLASVTSLGELPEVFERISDLTQQMIAHDAVFLTVKLADGTHGRVYASKAPARLPFPEIVDVPPAIVDNPHWEYDIVEDLQAAADQRHLWTTRNGYLSTLRLPLHLDNEFVAGLSFLSFSRGAYSVADVPVGKRIADRVALSFARERGAVLLKRADEATARASRLESRVRELTDELDARTGYRRVVGKSQQWRQVLTQATQVAATDTTVLLLGESGTGKEVVARFLHRASGRSHGPFIALNCAALPEQLLEAELFGYERGAYTGATQSKPGQLEQAAGGMLFLDEVGEMSPSAQAKFLRVLQEREFQRLGGTRVLKTDARIVAATNRDLPKAITLGQFREDLYYRLNVFAIQLPPLRERRDDILPLSEAFLAEISRGLGRPPSGISLDARSLLMEYQWPGNVRELRNILERAAILCDGALITAQDLSLRLGPPSAAPTVMAAPAVREAAAMAAPARPSSVGDLLSMERTMIEEALQAARFNKSKAAKALGLTRQQLYVRMRKYGLE